jgi:iron complex outermembrane receptor protein
MTTSILSSRSLGRNFRGPLLAVFSAFFLILAGVPAGAAAKEGDAPNKTYNLPADDAARTLKAFSDQSGEQIVYPVEQVRGVKTNAVRGELSARAALDQMLKDTGLVAVQDEKTGALAVKKDQFPNGPRVAQQDSDRPDQSQIKDGQLVLEKVEVTGSRLLQTAGQASITPVISISSEDFVRYGVSNLSDLRRAIPQLGPNTNGNEWITLEGNGPSNNLANRSSFSIGGLNLANSGVGGITLVLVDGRRLSKSGQSFSGQGNLEDYDLNGLPLEAIERIDILTGGASAIYGADAMAGVINVVLKKGDRSYSTASLRYDNTFSGDAAVKTAAVTTSVRRGKLSLLATVSYQQSNALASRDRWFTATSNLTTFGGQYDNRSSYLGALLLPDGSAVAIPAGSRGTATAAAFAAAGTPAIYDGAEDINQTQPTRDRSVLIKADYDIASWFKPYAEVRVNEKASSFILYPYFGAYYPAYDISYGLYIPAGVAGNPYATDVQLNKIYRDLPQINVSTSRNPSFTLGAEGDFHAWRDWHYDTYYSWNRSDQNFDGSSGFDQAKVGAALAAPNAPLLVYDSAAGNPNGAGVLESLMAASWSRERSDTSTFNFSVRGSVVTLPAGDLQVVGGAEWLGNRSLFRNDPDNGFSAFLLSGVISRDDRAVFAETQIPLLSDKQHIPLVNLLEANASIRHDDYSDVGGATTKTFAGLFRPFSWLTLRGSRSEGFKPADLWDLYAPYFLFPYPTSVGPGQYTMISDPERGGEQVVGTINTFIVGDPTLKPTTSVSKNAGVVLDVPFVRGLSFAVDFTKTDIRNAIGSVDDQTLVDYFPSHVIRAASTDGQPGKIIAINTSNVNTASYETESVSYTIAYQRMTKWGNLSLQGTFTNPTLTRSRYNAAAALTEAWLPQRASGTLSWVRGPLGLSLSTVYQSSFNIYPAYLANGYDDSYPSYIEWNPGATYDFGRARGMGGNGFWSKALKDMQVSTTIVNVFNHGPSLAQAALGHLSEDARGRRYVIELKKKF